MMLLRSNNRIKLNQKLELKLELELLRRCCCCCLCCCRCCKETPQAAATTQFKVLLLGASGSGKTQLGLHLSGKQRDADDLGPTNGVRCYRIEAGAEAEARVATLLLTEVGGSADMQRIWPYYYASCNALIFCFDLSNSNEMLQANFDLLQRCLQHEAMRGKPVLLVATRHRDGVQLYDVEHAFGLDELARSTGCPLHTCHMTDEDLWQGVAWLQRLLQELAPTLTHRVKYDVNLQSWQQRKRSLLSSGKLQQVHRQRFRRGHRKLWPMAEADEVTRSRPNTAPAAIFFVRSPRRPSKP
ncbi:probable ADP-ribosylation factor At2g15310 [Drosophila innubila]|uniref:probable ADP-ribosylation factor At2g15310 n=1 Tax=Drosophila innubila TaxID=198719 RepID=UPI00148C3B44|nr:probable ADP-ribosylation factor At2g15310 [Drosophila innubila]